MLLCFQFHIFLFRFFFSCHFFVSLHASSAVVSIRNGRNEIKLPTKSKHRPHNNKKPVERREKIVNIFVVTLNQIRSEKMENILFITGARHQSYLKCIGCLQELVICYKFLFIFFFCRCRFAFILESLLHFRVETFICFLITVCLLLCPSFLLQSFFFSPKIQLGEPVLASSALFLISLAFVGRHCACFQEWDGKSTRFGLSYFIWWN